MVLRQLMDRHQHFRLSTAPDSHVPLTHYFARGAARLVVEFDRLDGCSQGSFCRPVKLTQRVACGPGTMFSCLERIKVARWCPPHELKHGYEQEWPS